MIVSLLRALNVIPVPLLDTQPRAVATCALLEANRLRVFHALADAGNGMTPAQVAAHCALSVNGTAVLLNALHAMGYLRRHDDRYANGRWVRKWILDPQHGLHNLLRLQCYTYKRLEQLGDNIRSGTPSVDHHAIGGDEHTPRQDMYTLGMREAARLFIPALLKRARLPSGSLRMLDLGGAHGEYSRAMVRHHGNLRATIMDLPGPIGVARRITEAEGNPERIELVAGDAFAGDIGSGWNVILLANFVHLFNAEQNALLLQRCHAALAPGGVVLIMDQFLGLGGARDKLLAITSLNFFNVGGQCYPIDEMCALTTGAGFARAEVRRFPLWIPGSLIVGHKAL